MRAGRVQQNLQRVLPRLALGTHEGAEHTAHHGSTGVHRHLRRRLQQRAGQRQQRRRLAAAIALRCHLTKAVQRCGTDPGVRRRGSHEHLRQASSQRGGSGSRGGCGATNRRRCRHALAYCRSQQVSQKHEGAALCGRLDSARGTRQLAHGLQGAGGEVAGEARCHRGAQGAERGVGAGAEALHEHAGGGERRGGHLPHVGRAVHVRSHSCEGLIRRRGQRSHARRQGRGQERNPGHAGRRGVAAASKRGNRRHRGCGRRRQLGHVLSRKCRLQGGRHPHRHLPRGVHIHRRTRRCGTLLLAGTLARTSASTTSATSHGTLAIAAGPEHRGGDCQGEPPGAAIRGREQRIQHRRRRIHVCRHGAGALADEVAGGGVSLHTREQRAGLRQRHGSFHGGGGHGGGALERRQVRHHDGGNLRHQVRRRRYQGPSRHAQQRHHGALRVTRGHGGGGVLRDGGRDDGKQLLSRLRGYGRRVALHEQALERRSTPHDAGLGVAQTRLHSRDHEGRRQRRGATTLGLGNESVQGLAADLGLAAGGQGRRQGSGRASRSSCVAGRLLLPGLLALGDVGVGKQLVRRAVEHGGDPLRHGRITRGGDGQCRTHGVVQSRGVGLQSQQNLLQRGQRGLLAGLLAAVCLDGHVAVQHSEHDRRDDFRGHERRDVFNQYRRAVRFRDAVKQS